MGPKGHVLAGISKYWVCICMYWFRSSLFSVQDNWAFNGWLCVTALWQTPSGSTDRKTASCGGPSTALQTVLVTSKAGGGGLKNAVPAWALFKGLDCASVQPAGTSASGTSWWYWHHSAQSARQDGFVLSWGPGECDNVVKPGTGSTLFYINTWAMVFPSDHPAEWKPKHKLITGISTVNVAWNVDWSAVWHQIGMFTINSWSNTSIYWPIQTNTNPCILIHTAILKTV